MARGNHALVECWCVYVQPSKRMDPRAPARQTTYSINNKEMAYCNRFASPASPGKGTGSQDSVIWCLGSCPGGSLGCPLWLLGCLRGLPGCPWGVLGCHLGWLWGSWGGSSGVLGICGGCLGGPWEAPGSPWGSLGCPMGVHGGSLGPPRCEIFDTPRAKQVSGRTLGPFRISSVGHQSGIRRASSGKVKVPGEGYRER